MKKFLLVCAVLSFAAASYAYDKGEMYVAPVLGYHFFDNDHKLDDNAEGGLRFGKFFTDSIALEGEVDYTNTNKDKGGNTDAVSLNLNAVKHFDLYEKCKPYAFVGLGEMIYDQDHQGFVAGFGSNHPITENLALDLRVKDMYMTDGRNDIVPSVALNYFFGKPVKTAPVAVVKEEPKPAPAPAPVVVKTDSDGDGVYDDADQCPMTPKGAAVDAKGCPVDSDHDGVYDYADKCPNTPAGVKVDMKGCPLDSDGDGVYDYLDNCPNTPAGAKVDVKGCPLDTDGDGVYDYLDKCPGTPKGYKVNADGCFVTVTLNINFKTSSDEIVESYESNLKEFAAFLNANPTMKVEIQGYTDNRGSASYNKKLSQKRADSVVKELSKNYGVDSSRLTAVGYGEENPVAPNDTPENMLKNRRIESVVK